LTVVAIFSLHSNASSNVIVGIYTQCDSESQSAHARARTHAHTHTLHTHMSSDTVIHVRLDYFARIV
jgi:hypothetical protein